MEENVRKELETLKGMVIAWRESYRQAGSADGSDEFLIHEFAEEIQLHVHPYARRLCECNYLSTAEVDEFLNFCDRQVEELRHLLKLPTS
jgi:hypothetical protein